MVGNPPFIGNKRMRAALGDGYAGALRRTYSRVPESADLLMYWWRCGLVGYLDNIYFLVIIIIELNNELPTHSYRSR
uniref:Methyltransferase domain n=1 Tax=Candidatus Kentrum sp. LPFa TaxID=2126335 RepID=A0A450WEQ3_9GAMM|nr:MAG: Methyltransferase domain [Candidatus Kentron sp. LPFa]VFK30761.1 MAG: Methyltransferase domain [Candidatus Kentron sp. LPFa]